MKPLKFVPMITPFALGVPPKVVPPLRQRKLIGGVPEAEALKVTLLPATAVWPTGCCVKIAANSTVRVALVLAIEP